MALSYVGSGSFQSLPRLLMAKTAAAPPFARAKSSKLTVKKKMMHPSYASRIRLVRAGLSRARRARARVRRQRLLMFKNARSN
ncbi:MAG: hypothetical protein QOG23_2166 [Blastocatellia bacterium]|nr:hypothetical protein [Blastocatellia bacterium]